MTLKTRSPKSKRAKMESAKLRHEALTLVLFPRYSEHRKREPSSPKSRKLNDDPANRSFKDCLAQSPIAAVAQYCIV